MMMSFVCGFCMMKEEPALRSIWGKKLGEASEKETCGVPLTREEKNICMRT